MGKILVIGSSNTDLIARVSHLPAAGETLDNKVIKLLKEEFGAIKEIKSVKGVSDNLMTQDKDILKKRRKKRS